MLSSVEHSSRSLFVDPPQQVNAIVKMQLPVRQSRPGQTLGLGMVSGITDQALEVRFFNKAGYTISLPASSASPVEVATPIYASPKTGRIGSGAVSVELVLPDGTIKTFAGALRILQPVAPKTRPGVATLNYLNGLLADLSAAQAIAATAATTNTGVDLVNQQMGQDIQDITASRNAIDAYLNSAGPAPVIGDFQRGKKTIYVRMDSGNLKTSDEMVGNVVWPSSSASTQLTPGITAVRPTTEQAQDANAANAVLATGKQISNSALIALGVLGVLHFVGVGEVLDVGLLAGVTFQQIGVAAYVSATAVAAIESARIRIADALDSTGQIPADLLRPEAEYILSNTLTVGLGGELSAAVEGLGAFGGAAFSNETVGAIFGEAAAKSIDLIDTVGPNLVGRVADAFTSTVLNLFNGPDGNDVVIEDDPKVDYEDFSLPPQTSPFSLTAVQGDADVEEQGGADGFPPDDDAGLLPVGTSTTSFSAAALLAGAQFEEQAKSSEIVNQEDRQVIITHTDSVVLTPPVGTGFEFGAASCSSDTTFTLIAAATYTLQASNTNAVNAGFDGVSLLEGTTVVASGSQSGQLQAGTYDLKTEFVYSEPTPPGMPVVPLSGADQVSLNMGF